MSVSEVLGSITSHLQQSGIAYMLVGSFASAFHGALRSTRDIDIVIEATPEQLRELVVELQATDYYVELDAALSPQRRRAHSIARNSAAAWRPSFLISSCSWPALMMSLSRSSNGQNSGSQRHIEDVAKVLTVQWKALDQTYLSKWIGELQLQEQWSAAKQAAEIPD